MLTLKQAAELATDITEQRVTPGTLRSAANRGDLRAHKPARDWLTTAEDVAAYLEKYHPRPSRK